MDPQQHISPNSQVDAASRTPKTQVALCAPAAQQGDYARYVGGIQASSKPGAAPTRAENTCDLGHITAFGERRVTLQQVNNVRDLGGIPVAGDRIVTPGLMYRGGALRNATQSDLALMFDELGIRRVIDLRVGYERTAKPDPEVAGVENLFIPFYDNDIVGREYFKSVPGTIVMGKDFACDPDDFYRDMANELTSRQISRALHAVIDAAMAGQATYFHCSNGKDRAGILTLLLLEMLGASDDAILEDYLLTNVWRDTVVEGIYQRFLRLCQGDEQLARRITAGHCARPQNLVAFRASVDAHYGSMDHYIDDVLGFSNAERSSIRAQLTTPAPDRN